MQQTEKTFQDRLRSGECRYRDKPEIAEASARWLLAQKRYRDAALVTRAALDQGPRFDLHELRAYTTLTGLEKLWKKIHDKQGVIPAEHGTDIYNNGMERPDPDRSAVPEKTTGT